MNYVVIKKAISEDLTNFLFNYLKLKQKVLRTMVDSNYISAFNVDFGRFGDGQVPDQYCIFGDPAFDSLLDLIKPKLEKEFNTKLYSTYSYCRLYEKGSELPRHKDRISCSFSTTLNLGGDIWPIYLDPNYKNGKHNKDYTVYKPGNKKGKKIKLNPGDMLVYKGDKLEHWREPFTGKMCGQVFLHYVDKSLKKFINDTRPHLGLPPHFTNKD
jgi:hypothetical protein